MDHSDRTSRARRRPRLLRRPAILRCLLSLCVFVLFGCADAGFRSVPTGHEPRAPMDAARGGAPGARGSSHVDKVGAAGAGVAAVDVWARGHSDSTFSVAVLDRRTGELAVGDEGSKQQYSASLVKLMVAVDIVQRSHSGLLVTDQDRELISRALGASDDNAMNELWTRFDGMGAVTRLADQLGLVDTDPPGDPAQWGETLMSARDMVRLCDYVLSELPAPDSAFIVDSLSSGPRTAPDGFDQVFGLRAAQPPDGSIASKAAWMCCLDGEITLHSVGIVDSSNRFVVALLSSQPASRGYGDSREVLTDAAQVLVAELR